jgi:hypothetical protein
MTTLTATAERPQTEIKASTFNELPMWTIIEVGGLFYRKQDHGQASAGQMAHNMSTGGFVKWSEFRPQEEKYVSCGAVYKIAQ